MVTLEPDVEIACLPWSTVHGHGIPANNEVFSPVSV
jgi:hypothetical protein